MVSKLHEEKNGTDFVILTFFCNYAYMYLIVTG